MANTNNASYYSTVLKAHIDLRDEPLEHRENWVGFYKGVDKAYFSWRPCLDREACDETFQNVHERGLRFRQKITEANYPEALAFCMFRHSVYTSLDRRKRWRQTMEGLTSLSESVPDPLWESSLTEEERIRRVRIQAILDDVAKTEPTAARVAVYYYDPDVRRTYKDTAVHFGISEYVVGRHLRRVRQFLRACYSDDRRFLFGPHHSRKNGRRRRK